MTPRSLCAVGVGPQRRPLPAHRDTTLNKDGAPLLETRRSRALLPWGAVLDPSICVSWELLDLRNRRHHARRVEWLPVTALQPSARSHPQSGAHGGLRSREMRGVGGTGPQHGQTRAGVTSERRREHCCWEQGPPWGGPRGTRFRPFPSCWASARKARGGRKGPETAREPPACCQRLGGLPCVCCWPRRPRLNSEFSRKAVKCVHLLSSVT